jgi:predicted nuclease of restriction endonuclease-like (RecB) superfamily
MSKPVSKAKPFQTGPTEFADVLRIIQAGRAKAFEAVNLALMETYWAVGQHLHQKVAEAAWGKGVVKELAQWLQTHAPDAKGFSSQNLWRMKQFYETFSADEKLSAVPRVLSWTHYCTLMGRCKSNEERLFYTLSTQRAGWSTRELDKQISTGAFERTMLADTKLSALPKVLPPEAASVFKDSYLLDFLNLPQPHSEAQLQTALLRNLRHFLMELGDGFAFVGEKVRLQVGSQDFELDLLFFHRDLQCLVAFELKTGHFEPGHMGQLAFYLEALDRDRKRPHENPSIGVLLCGSKDDEVVEYAMSRQLSPAMVAQYETQMIAKSVLQQKLHEWQLMLRGPDADADMEDEA